MSLIYGPKLMWLKRLLAQVKLESSQDFRDDKYLSGASQFLILPELNTLEVEVEGRKFTLLEYLNMDPDVISAEDISGIPWNRHNQKA